MIQFPRDLVPLIRRYVETSFYPSKPFTLPADELLKEFLDVAFYASLRTEEGRLPGFRMALLSPELKDGDAEHNLHVLRRVKFASDRPYKVEEIVQLAAASDFSRTLIGVWGSETPKCPVLRIWGLADAGDQWHRFIRHEARQVIGPPTVLTVTSRRAGDLSVSLEGRVVANFKAGQITLPGLEALVDERFTDFLIEAMNELYNEVVAMLGVTQFDETGSEDAFPHMFYLRFLKRVLHRVGEKRHGGTILMIPDDLMPKDTRLKKRLSIKYACNANYAWEALRDFLVNLHQLIELEIVQSKVESISKDDLRYRLGLKRVDQQFSEMAGDLASLIGNMTGVDGAVLITDHFRLLGFGTELIATSPHLEHVLRQDKDQETRISIEHFGTRHRSAFRICSSFKQCVAFVVSQDGGVKAVKRVGSDVLLWPEVIDGSRGL